MTERFSGLKYNPKKATRPLDQEFPELFRHPEFKKIKEVMPSWERVVSYILFLYSKETDLLHEHPSDLKSRKEAAALEAGYERQAGGAWPPEIDEIMAIRNQDVIPAIMQWLKIQKHAIWTELVITSEELFDFQKLRIKPLDQTDSDKDVYEAAKKKDVLMQACNDRIKVIESLMGQFYGDSRNDLSEYAEIITPENAERLLFQPVEQS